MTRWFPDYFPLDDLVIVVDNRACGYDGGETLVTLCGFIVVFFAATTEVAIVWECNFLIIAPKELFLLELLANTASWAYRAGSSRLVCVACVVLVLVDVRVVSCDCCVY